VFAQATDILVRDRFPRHADVANWFGAAALLKIVAIGTGVWLVRHRPIFPVLCVPFTASIVLSIVQIVSANRSLALAFPWRPSVWLVPVSLALIVGQLVMGVAPWIDRLARERAGRVGVAVAVGLLALFGIAGTLLESKAAGMRPEAHVIAWARANTSATDVYLIPPELEEFRLRARVPIVADTKTHPY
jgi:hypothetical protein